jgi:FkbM family methyltransferase
MLNRIKRMILGTRMEILARRLYLRFDPSEGGQYDREALSIMRQCLSCTSNCIDIGAHRGSILNEIVALSPQGTHFAFEPVPEHFRYLAKNFPQVKVYSLALSNIKKKRDFTHIVSHPTRSGFNTLVEGGEAAETISVDTDLLDAVIPHDLNIHFIKLDVEGAEFQVLQGGRETISRNKPLIIFEHGLFSHTLYGATSQDVYHLLVKDCGMQISLLRGWLERKPALECDEFVAEVEQNQQYYFVAYPS